MVGRVDQCLDVLQDLIQLRECVFAVARLMAHYAGGAGDVEMDFILPALECGTRERGATGAVLLRIVKGADLAGVLDLNPWLLGGEKIDL